MSEVRITVEWILKEVNAYCTSADFKRKMRLQEYPVGTMYNVTLFWTNMPACLYLKPTSLCGTCRPPHLNDYNREEI